METTTGRYLVVLNQNRQEAAVTRLQAVTGDIADSREFATSSLLSTALAAPAGLVLHHIGIAITTLEQDQQLSLQAAGDDVLTVEPERYVYAISSDEYLHGFRDGVEAMYRASHGKVVASPPVIAAQTFDESRVTWGLQACGVSDSKYTGDGIRVAVLDTGLDLNHPDFTGRGPIVSQAFVDGVTTAQDGHGHGTHCAGTIWGPSTPASGPRYGIAPRAQLFIGKVLDDQGTGTDGAILGGINWAISHGCNIISMSLGAPVAPGSAYSPAYEQAASAALESGVLIVAAAGNDSRRPAVIAPVGRPANCPSILAVAAIDDQMAIAYFSDGQVGSGKAPAIAAPGVQVYSSWLLPRAYNTISGTSMATPHVSGIAALLAQAHGARGSALSSAVVASAKAIGLAASDVGAGLVHAP